MSNPFAAPNPPPEPPPYGTPAPHGTPDPYGAPTGYGAQSTFGSPPPGYAYGYQPVPSTNGKAIASLVLGILGLLCFGLFTGVPAIFLGSSARREIRGGKGTGDGIALAGIVIGWAVTALTVLGLLFVLAVFVTAPEVFDTAP